MPFGTIIRQCRAHPQGEARRPIKNCHGSEQIEDNAIGFDAGHALAIERPPGTLTFLAGNAEVTAADNGRVLERMASPLDFLGVARVEAELPFLAIGFDELDGDDGAASIKDEALHQFSFALRLKDGCHGLMSSGPRGPYGKEIRPSSQRGQWEKPLAMLIGQGPSGRTEAGG